MRRHALQHGRRAGFEADAVRQFDQHGSRHRRIFGIRSAMHRISHPVARLYFGDFPSHGFHRTRALHPWSERQVELIEPDAMINVDKVDARRGDLDQSLLRPGRRLWPVHVLELFGTSGLRYQNQFHETKLSVISFRLSVTTLSVN